MIIHRKKLNCGGIGAKSDSIRFEKRYPDVEAL